jgi:histidinol-phosphate aminotransferase
MIPSIRSNIRAMTGYTPGEQPRDGEYIKLNTNENPYPPSPRVFEAIQKALTGDRLRKYPDPLGHEFRETAARVLGIDPASILIGNGSDDVLTILTRAFVPDGGLIVSPTPSYLLYKTLAEIQGARYHVIPFTDDWRLDASQVPGDVNLSFLPNPNSPTGTIIPAESLAHWSGPLVIDEAYVDFADSNCLQLLKRTERMVVTRSLSKSYSLAGIRFGFAVANPGVIAELYKIKDSYNCDVLSLVAATAALADQAHMLANRARIIATRNRLTKALRGLGFEVCDSQANFVWCRHRDRRMQPRYLELKRRKILVRYMHFEGYGEGLRISIGTDAEIDRLVEEMIRIG